ncbi:hypothetical protein KR032_000274, partial [Drosophila birchii]
FLLSCLVVIIGSLVWTASAQQDFESDREHLIEVYKNASPGSVGDSNVLFLVKFLEKYADQIQLTPEQRSKAADIVRHYSEDKAKQPLVDGVPPQGGWNPDSKCPVHSETFCRHLAVRLGKEIASEGIKKTES